MKRLVLFGAAAALACMPATVNADWSDNFDSYEDGQWLDGTADDGGWKGWFNDPQWGAQVTSLFSNSAPHSVDIVANADLVHEYEGVNSGEWLYTAWQYIPGSFSGQSYYIMQNTYNDQGTDLNWSLQVRYDSGLGMMEAEFDGQQLPYITDQWVKLEVWIDFDDDEHTFFYNDNGVLFYQKSWTDGVSGGGALNLGAIDLYANGATSVYYDDFSLAPVPGGECPWDNSSSGAGPPDGTVDIDDVFGVVGNWGDCPDPPEECPWDNSSSGGGPPDGKVDIDDVFGVISNWGDCPAAVGACCFETDPQCFDLLENECILAGGTFYGTFNNCAEFVCPPPPDNDSCENARPIDIDGESVIDDTTGMGIPNIPGCADAGDLQSGTRFYYVIGDGTELTAHLCNDGMGQWDASISVFCSYCPDALMCATGDNDSDNTYCFIGDYVHPEAIWCSEPGVIYYIAVYGSPFASPNEGVFELKVTSGDVCDNPPLCGCEITCDGTPEGEPCLEDGTVENPTVDVT
ncbi:MAG: hypothetical protein JSV91_10295, partial [Phycisphaerales bacterium]